MCATLGSFIPVEARDVLVKPINISVDQNMQSDNIDKLSEALAKAQSAMRSAIYNKINPHFKNKYADLASVIDAIRDPLSKHGLSFTQTIQPLNGGGLYLHTTLRHSSGQWVSSIYPLPSGAKPQEMGSALTYARRYSLSAIAGIAADDDDDAESTKPITPEQVELLGIELQHRDDASLKWLLKNISTVTKGNVERLEDIPEALFARAISGLKNRPPKETSKETSKP